ncbi:MAG: amidohydrolase family protein [Candidatus Jordarchaeum sp.]|uniref:amidohydrolase family protein n=1 Tax=Candidatus Jordarchaeum sp. TaxID=2823881 RepID=UPI00404B52EC
MVLFSIKSSYCCKPSQILFGSDYPFAPENLTAEQVKQLTSYNGFDAAARMRIERENALKLFPRLRL